ncbi:MAG: PT domain-containing protein, partial [Nocardioidaceae bacterium]|nr:PT domain-containing protein [Nocardioidaceae bacterium]
MIPLKRPLAAAGAAVLLGLSLSACGGSPTDASTDDFCDAVQGLSDPDGEFVKAVKDKDWDAVADAVKKQANNIEDVGTPKNMSEDARKGWELTLDEAKGISGDDIKKSFEDNKDPFDEDDLSKDEQKNIDAFQDYQDDTCDSDDAGTSVPSGVPTDLPSDLPTDLPSDLPTGLPTDVPT